MTKRTQALAALLLVALCASAAQGAKGGWHPRLRTLLQDDSPPPSPPSGQASLGDPIKVAPVPTINSNLAPNCFGNNAVFNPNYGPSNIYKSLNPNLASYYDPNVPQRPNGQDELLTYMIQVCNYLASVSTAPDGTRLCCRLVDIYGDFFATQNVWGPVITGRLDYDKMPYNRGVNFTNANATSQALLTKYSAWDPITNPEVKKCSLPAKSTTSQTCQKLEFSAATNFQTQKTSAWDISTRVSLTTTFSSGVELVATASDSITVGASFSLSKSQTNTITKGSSISMSAYPSADMEPGDCYSILSTKQQQKVTYQLRSRAALAGPVFMYFSLSPSSPMNYDQINAAIGWDASGKKTSSVTLKGNPKFKVPAPVGKNQSIPLLKEVGNWNAPDVTFSALGPYLNPWTFNDGPADIIQALFFGKFLKSIPGQAVTHPADYPWAQGRLSSDDYYLLRGQPVYIATAQDFVAAAQKLGFVVDDYHKSLMDNGTYTKVDNVDITTYRNLVWTRPTC